MPSFDPDFSRNRAHRIYNEAGDIATQAGAYTQDARLDAFKNLQENPNWLPEEGWADQFQDGGADLLSILMGPAAQPKIPVESRFQAPEPSAISFESLNDENVEARRAFDEWALDPEDLSKRENLKKLNPEFKAAQTEYGQAAARPREINLSQEERDRIDAAANDLENEYWYQDPKINISDVQGNDSGYWTGSALSGNAVGSDDIDLSDSGMPEDLRNEREDDIRMARELAEQAVRTNSGDLEGTEAFDLQMKAARNIDDLTGLPGDWVRRVRSQDHGFDPLKAIALTSQNYSSDATNDVYNKVFSSDEQKELQDTIMRASINGAGGELSPTYFTDVLDNNGVVNKRMIDDGRAVGREGIYMTGEQYIKYVEAGIPGRPVEAIDPNALYSKQDEMENFGFIPYIASSMGERNFAANANINALANAVDSWTNARTNLARDTTSYTYDGKEYSYKDVNEASNILTRDFLNGSVEDKYFVRSEEPFEGSLPLGRVITLDDGSEVWVDGNVRRGELPDGRPFLDTNGNKEYDEGDIVFNDENDFRASYHEKFIPEGEDVIPSSYGAYSPVKTSSGNEIPFSLAMESSNNSKKFLNESIFGPINSELPNLVEDPRGWAETAPAAYVDMLLQSSPLFYTPAALTQAIGTAGQSINGVRGRTADGTYKLLSENPTAEQTLTTAAANLTLPATERIWGLGNAMFRTPLERAIIETYGPGKLDNKAAQYLLDMFGEGIEEIPGNLVEELIQQGSFSDLFANDYYYWTDSNGKEHLTTSPTGPNGEKLHKKYDSQGKGLRDSSTSSEDRIANFARTWPEAFLGGAVLGGSLGIPKLFINDADMKYRQNERNKFGDNLNIPQEVIDYTNREIERISEGRR